MTDIPYCGPPPVPGTLLTSWNFDPVLLIALAGAAAVTGRIRGSRKAWLAGVILLALAFVSPICAWASALFSVRVLHHVIVVAVAAPLLIVGLGWRVQSAGAAFLAHLAMIWLWHIPAPYAFALGSDIAYWMMELSLLGSAMWLWAAMMARVGPAMALSLGTLVQMGLLGALLTFAGRPLFEAHYFTTAAFGLSPLEDQQLAGLLMWVPAAFPYLGFALYRLCAHVLPGARA